MTDDDKHALHFVSGVSAITPSGSRVVVLAKFRTLEEEWRIATESPGAPGAVSLWHPRDLELAPEEKPCPRCTHPWKYHGRDVGMDDVNGERHPQCIAAMGMGDWCGCRMEMPSV